MISVIMSVYKPNQKYLDEAIQSILNQSYKDFEFIIVNDGNDEYITIPDDPRIRVIGNKTNIGLTKSLNIALREAKGEYIARMDADDISLPYRFEKQVKFLKENPDYALVGSWIDIIDEHSDIIRLVKYPCKASVLKRELIKYNPLAHSSIMFRKGWYYNEAFKYAQDYELYFRISGSTGVNKIGNIDTYLHQYRENNNSITAKKNRQQILCVLRAKFRYFLRNGYKLRDTVYLVKTCLTLLLPVSTKRLIKNIIYTCKRIIKW